MAERVCPQCGGPFDVPPSSRKVYCSTTCRVRHHEGKAAAAVPKRRPRPPDYRIQRQVLKELREVKREGSALGLLALDLAGQLGARDLPPATRVGLAKELRATLGEALKGAKKATSVDDLKGRRDAKRRAARARVAAG